MNKKTKEKRLRDKLKKLRKDARKESRGGGKKMVGGKHFQHSALFNRQLNAVNNVPDSPFRYYDEVWKIGKYKGISLLDTPIQYIKWAYSSMILPPTAKSILEKYLT